MPFRCRLNPRLHLAAAIGWSVFAVVTLAALAAAHLAAQSAENRTRADAQTLLAEFATQVRDALPMNLETRRSLLQALAAQINASRPADAAGIKESLEEVRERHPEYLWLGIVEGPARVFVGTGNVPQDLSEALPDLHRQGRDRPFVSGPRAVAGASDASVAAPSPGRFVAMAVPLDAPVAARRVLAATIAWSWIEQLLAKMQDAFNQHRDLQVMLADREGNVLAGPGNWVGRRLTRGMDVTEGGAFVAGSRAQLRLADGMGFEWTVIVRQRADQALAPARMTRRSVFSIVFVAGLFAALAGVQVTRLLTRRLAALAREAEAVHLGRQHRLHPPAGTDEINRIGTTLAGLVDHLQSEKQALMRLNSELDNRVAERTQRIAQMAEEAQHAAVTRERLRMARDLHDTLAQSLMALLTQIRLVRKLHGRMDAPELDAELERAEGVAAAGLSNTRAAIKQMRDNEVRDIGLGPALRDLAGRLAQRTGLSVSVETDPTASAWSDERAETAFRLAEESLRNVERHAQAKTVAIALRSTSDQGRQDGTFQEPGVSLEISDDGVGFDPHAPQPGHYGVRGMREQAVLIGGRLAIDSGPGMGTRVTLRFDRSAVTGAGRDERDAWS